MESMARLWYDGTDVSFKVKKSVYDPCPAGWRLPSKGVLDGYDVSADRATVEADNGHNGTPYGFIPYSGYVDYTGSIVPDMGVFMFYTSQQDVPVWYSKWADGTRYETTGGNQLSKFAANAASVRCVREDQ